MTRYGRRFWLIGLGLAGLAGYVDALGFIRLGGFFVSFMSGNSTRLAVGLARHGPDAMTAATLIAAFVAGVVIASLVSHIAGARRQVAVLALTTAMLAVAAFADHHALRATWLLAMAMGGVNTVFQHHGEVTVGLTYMTGSLVKMGQRIAAALTGGERWGWVPHLLLWTTLTAGAVVGAWASAAPAGLALWAAAGVALVLTVIAGILALIGRHG